MDLLEHAAEAAASPEDIACALGQKLASGRFDRDRLYKIAERYGSRTTRALVRDALAPRAA